MTAAVIMIAPTYIPNGAKVHTPALVNMIPIKAAPIIPADPTVIAPTNPKDIPALTAPTSSADHRGLENIPVMEISRMEKRMSSVATPQLRSSIRHLLPLASGPVMEKAIQRKMIKTTQNDSLPDITAIRNNVINQSTRVLVASHSSALIEDQSRNCFTCSITTASFGYTLGWEK
jgi:hypothetical protein